MNDIIWLFNIFFCHRRTGRRGPRLSFNGTDHGKDNLCRWVEWRWWGKIKVGLTLKMKVHFHINISRYNFLNWITEFDRFDTFFNLPHFTEIRLKDILISANIKNQSDQLKSIHLKVQNQFIDSFTLLSVWSLMTSS